MNQSDPNNEVTPVGEISGGILSVVGSVTPWKTYLIYLLLAVIVAEGIGLVWMRGTVATAKVAVVNMEKQVQTMNIALQVAQMNEKSCRVNLKDQNNKISDAGTRYNELLKDFRKLEQQIKDGDYYKDADDVRNQTTPKTCEEALDFMNRNIP